jgi:hypothetical protein
MHLFMKAGALGLGLATSLAIPGAALADKIKHPIAVFSGLDKITGRIKSFEVAIDETVQFGTLQITPRVCFSRPTTEAPQTDVFAEVDEVEPDKSLHHVFGGWMFADSPGLHGIEHPIYDIWLLNCVGDGPLIHEAPVVADIPDDPIGADPNGASPNPVDPKTQIQIVAPKKPRKPKAAAIVAAPPPPLDLNNQSTYQAPSGGRNGAAGRSQPFDPPPIPPADIQ